MSKAWIMADSKQWAKVLVEVSKETNKVLDETPADPLEKGAFAAFVASLREETSVLLAYLPPGERGDMEALCATWLDVGMLFGRSPAILVEILERTQTSIGVLVKEDKGGDEE